MRNIKEKFVRIYMSIVLRMLLFLKKCKYRSVPSVEHRFLPVAAILCTHLVSLVKSNQKT